MPQHVDAPSTHETPETFLHRGSRSRPAGPESRVPAVPLLLAKTLLASSIAITISPESKASLLESDTTFPIGKAPLPESDTTFPIGKTPLAIGKTTFPIGETLFPKGKTPSPVPHFTSPPRYVQGKSGLPAHSPSAPVPLIADNFKIQ